VAEISVISLFKQSRLPGQLARRGAMSVEPLTSQAMSHDANHLATESASKGNIIHPFLQSANIFSDSGQVTDPEQPDLYQPLLDRHGQVVEC